MKTPQWVGMVAAGRKIGFFDAAHSIDRFIVEYLIPIFNNVGNFNEKKAILVKFTLAIRMDMVYTVFTCGKKWEKVERRSIPAFPH
jgi:hypothetical protein